MPNIREIEPKPVRRGGKVILEIESKILDDILAVKHFYGSRKKNKENYKVREKIKKKNKDKKIKIKIIR